MTMKVLSSYQHQITYFQTNAQVSRILKLITRIAAQVRNMPAHAQWNPRAQHTAWIKLPAMIRIVQIAMRSKIILRNHCTFSIRELQEGQSSSCQSSKSVP